MIKCDYCLKDFESEDIHSDINNKWICSSCRYNRFKERYDLIKEIHNNEQNALIVQNYPYGFRLKTQAKYFIETTNKGDRLVFITLNPKTNKWNNPKKSTYSDIMVLIKEKETGHIKQYSYSATYTTQKELNQFLEFIKDYPLNAEQQKKIKISNAIHETRKFIKVEIRQQQFKHKITGEIKTQLSLSELNEYEKVTDAEQDAQQEQAKKNINKLFVKNALNEGLTIEELKTL